MNMTIVKRTDKTIKWAVEPKRWIIERTFAWLLNFRRLVINYERTTESAIGLHLFGHDVPNGKKY